MPYFEASYNQAKAQFEAGTKAESEARRSFVELQTQQQRLSSQQAQLLKDQMSRMPFGPESDASGDVLFRLWAPGAESIKLEILDGEELREIERGEEGW